MQRKGTSPGLASRAVRVAQGGGTRRVYKNTAWKVAGLWLFLRNAPKSWITRRMCTSEHRRLVTFWQTGDNDGLRAWSCDSRLSATFCHRRFGQQTVCRIVRIKRTRNVYRYHTAYLVVLVVAELLGQHSALCFVYVTYRPICIGDLIHSCVDFLVQIVVRASALSLNGPPNDIRQ